MKCRNVRALAALLLAVIFSSGYPIDYDKMPPPRTADFSPAICTVSLRSPCAFGTLSDHFGYRLSPLTGEMEFHYGIDLAAKQGSAVYAVLGGRVQTSGWDDSYGNFLIIDHGNGFMTCYAHCEKLLVKVDDRVKSGQQVAKIGNTGDSTGYHLHFEVRLGGCHLDPLWLFGDGSKLTCFSEEP